MQIRTKMFTVRVSVAALFLLGISAEATAANFGQQGDETKKETVGVNRKATKTRKQNSQQETKPPKVQRQASDGNSSEKGHQGSTGSPQYDDKHSDPIPRGSTPKQ